MIERREKSPFPGDQELPPHEDGIHPLRKEIAQVADFRDPFEVWDFRKKTGRLRGDRQKVKQKITADLESEIDARGPHPCQRIKT